jgi:cell wall-associated NlpC family hydrolase
MGSGSENTSGGLLAAGLAAILVAILAVLGLIVVVVAVIFPATSASCQTPGGTGEVAVSTVNVPPGLSAMARELWNTPLRMQAGHWYPVGATEYYAGDGTGSGHFGSIPDPGQANLTEHPDTFAELSLLPTNPANGGTFTFKDANALGTLPYMTGLRVARDGKSIVVYKRDTGYGQGPSEHTPEGFEYRIDLWGPSAQALGVSKDQVDIQLAPKTGAGEVLEATPGASEAGESHEASGEGEGEGESQCAGEPVTEGPLPLTANESAQILPDGLAAAPKNAPAAVQAMVAAGNRLHGTSYLYGGAHGTPLSELQPAYDCSSAVSFVLHAGGVFGEQAEDSTELESYGQPGPGKYVSVYANSGHAFMYVAGLRFDTSFEGTDTGPNHGKSGPRWRVFDHVPNWAPWVVRHPSGL